MHKKINERITSLTNLCKYIKYVDIVTDTEKVTRILRIADNVNYFLHGEFLVPRPTPLKEIDEAEVKDCLHEIGLHVPGILDGTTTDLLIKVIGIVYK